MIYLASPYTHPDASVRQQRADAVARHAAWLFANGEHVFSPIAHSHPIATHGLPGGWGYWASYDRWFLERVDRFIVLQLDGWDESQGVLAEIQMAESLGLVIEYQRPQEV